MKRWLFSATSTQKHRWDQSKAVVFSDALPWWVTDMVTGAGTSILKFLVQPQTAIISPGWEFPACVHRSLTHRQARWPHLPKLAESAKPSIGFNCRKEFSITTHLYSAGNPMLLCTAAEHSLTSWQFPLAHLQCCVASTTASPAAS